MDNSSQHIAKQAGIKTHRATLKETMDAYDSLPQELRKALQNSSNNWSAASLKEGLEKVGCIFLIDSISFRDKEVHKAVINNLFVKNE